MNKILDITLGKTRIRKTIFELKIVSIWPTSSKHMAAPAIFINDLSSPAKGAVRDERSEGLNLSLSVNKFFDLDILLAL